MGGFKMHRTLIAAFAIAGAALVGSALLPATAQQPTVQRKVLLTQDLPIPGYQSVMASVELPVGGREGRHTHPGAGFVYVLEGSITLEHEGRPTTTYKAGDTLSVDANKVHEGINAGSVPVKLVATFIVEKGKPLASPAP
jgi:quercetin dioxygenase-like cupin family protein